MSSPSVSLWSGRAPRRCQVEAFAAYVAARDAGSLSAGVFAAATGSGKSILLAEVVADQLQLLTGPSDVIVVTTPTVKLVEQLTVTLTERVVKILAGNPAMQGLADQHLLGLGQPGDMAHAALYLASDEARIVTGVILPVDSGLVTV